MKHKKYKNVSKTYVFDTWKEWKTIWIFWWIHGNETAWIKAICKLVEEIESWQLNLLNWKLILALWNFEAIEIWKREVKYNLNRLFKSEYLDKKSEEYEVKRMQELSSIIREVDILFDIHSVSSKSEPFMFAEDIWNEIEMASKIYNWNVIVWWGDFSWWVISWDSDSYAHSLWKIAFTIECWNHNDIKAGETAYKSSINLLLYFWLINSEKICNNKKWELIKMYKIKTTKTWNFNFIDWIDNFSEISKWDLIWYDSNEKIYAEEDFIILLPKYKFLEVWEEIFFYWKRIEW